MVFFLSLLGGLLILIMFLSLLKLTIVIDYLHEKDDDFLEITFKMLRGLIRYRKKIPMIKMDKKNANLVIKQENISKTSKNQSIKKISKHDIQKAKRSFNELVRQVQHLFVIIHKFFKKVKVLKWEWHTVIGTGEAASTGVAAGVMWTLKSMVIQFVSNYVNFQVSPDVSISPNFTKRTSKTSFKCMIQFRLGHAMIAGIRLMKWSRNKMALLKIFKKSSQDKDNEQKLKEVKI